MGGEHVFAVADAADDRVPAGSRAKLFAALTAGIIGGATLGAVLFGYRPVAPRPSSYPDSGFPPNSCPPTPTMPDPGTPPTPAAAQVPTPTPVEQTAAPNPVAAESETNEEVCCGTGDGDRCGCAASLFPARPHRRPSPAARRQVRTARCRTTEHRRGSGGAQTAPSRRSQSSRASRSTRTCTEARRQQRQPVDNEVAGQQAESRQVNTGTAAARPSPSPDRTPALP